MTTHDPPHMDGNDVRQLEAIIYQLRKEGLMLRGQVATVMALARIAVEERDEAQRELQRLQHPS